MICPMKNQTTCLSNGSALSPHATENCVTVVYQPLIWRADLRMYSEFVRTGAEGAEPGASKRLEAFSDFATANAFRAAANSYGLICILQPILID